MTTADTFALRPAPSAALDPEALEDLALDLDADYADWLAARATEAFARMELDAARADADAAHAA